MALSRHAAAGCGILRAQGARAGERDGPGPVRGTF